MQIDHERLSPALRGNQDMRYGAADTILPNLSHATTPPPDTSLSHGTEVFTTPHALPENEEDLLAIQALGKLKNSGQTTPVLEQRTFLDDADTSVASEVYTTQSAEDDKELIQDTGSQQEVYFDPTTDTESLSSRSSLSFRPGSKRARLYSKVRNHPIVNTAVQVYKENKPAIKYGVEMVENATLPLVNIIEQTSSEWKRKRRLTKANAMFPDEAKVDISSTSSFSLHSSKRQKLPSISEALSMGNRNWNDLSITMSFESKKRLQTCLQLLMLANKQLSSKVDHLQDVITKEQELLLMKQNSETKSNDSGDDDNEVFHDAIEDAGNGSDVIKEEIVGTIKKVVTFISKYAGNSLPEPARTDVREELLRLPTKWSTNAASTNSMLGPNTNAKVLVLANESLEMVRSVMSVFDDTLSKADLWVKQKQEKQLAKHAILNRTLMRQNIGNSSAVEVPAHADTIENKGASTSEAQRFNEEKELITE
ncbi:Transcriptional repressor OPI1 [Cyberlindnera fabianii]|uniref:Transcriptional repressor OPI1 n=1 Tax=Cyberlindnera fabianii TaxID=36022 RepID=A0A1V2LFW7_CYBFA|nr:Transcriptional repressor OPI1 [Cyberlindnera fabianii]